MHEIRSVKVVVVPKGEPLYSERATSIEIDDEAGGEFVKVTQHGGTTDCAKSILIDAKEWVTIKEAIEMMLAECRPSV